MKMSESQKYKEAEEENASKTNSWLVSLRAFNSLILINQKKKITTYMGIFNKHLTLHTH